MTDHQHCWHRESSWTKGYYGGEETDVCCWCGKRRQRKFRWVQDPEHGPHAQMAKIPEYED